MLDMIAQVPVFGGLLATVIPFLVVISIVVAIHEYGHYIVGRWCGIHADVFSLGFGRVIAQRTDRRGTVWQVAALPIGGYVKFKGDADAASGSDPHALDGLSETEARATFPGAPLWARSATIAAGPIANFLLATAIYAGFALVQGRADDTPVVGEIPPSVAAEVPLEAGDRILSVDGAPVDTFSAAVGLLTDADPAGTTPVQIERGDAVRTVELPYVRPPFIAGVRPLTAASRAGVRAGDVITAVDGARIVSFEQLRDVVTAGAGQVLDVEVRRGRDLITLEMEPTLEDVPQPDGSFAKQVIIGVMISTYLQPERASVGPMESVGFGAMQTYNVLAGSLDGLSKIITGEIGPENIQGPVGIAQVSGETATRGVTDFILLIAMISSAIGMMNLFPVPVLDGGHLMFNLWEAVTGSPPGEKVLSVAMGIGLATVLSLMVFATYNDLARLFGLLM